MKKLNDTKLKQWMNQKQPLAISDGGGLTFTLSGKGAAAWVLRYRYGGKAREITLGSYPDLGLSQARNIAAEYRVRVQQGIDVAREKQRAKREAYSAITFRELAEDYMEKIFPILAANTVYQRKNHITKIILPKLGPLAAKDVRPSDIVGLIEAVGIRSVSVAELVLTAASEICKHGMAKRTIDSNPCSGISIKAICGVAPPKRKRLMLTKEELTVLLHELPSTGRQNELATKILLSTCLRIGELTKAEWSHVDFESCKWQIPDANSKTGSGFTVPLVPQVIEWLSELKILACGSRYILPARRETRKQRFGGDMHFQQRSLNAVFDRLCDRLDGRVRRFTPHDLRSTARSHLSALGVNVFIAERCLNHRLGGLVGIYDQHDYLDERRTALEMWTSFLSTCD